MKTSFTLTDAEISEINVQKSSKETISQFAYAATMEKVNRLRQRNERARVQLFERDVAALRPVVEAIVKEMSYEKKGGEE